jgi:40-residue YVTN family beta-propeller repeat/40-residue YVTN family beta-propeller repeat
MLNIRHVNLIFVVFITIILSSFSVFAAANPNAYVGNFKDNTVSAIDIAKGEVVATIPVEAGPHGMILSTDGRWLYVSSDGSSSVNVIDTNTNKVSSLINVGKSPQGLSLSPDGKYLLVCVNGDDKIVYVDTKKKKIVASVKVGKPHTISVSPKGKVAYVTSQVVGKFNLSVIDLKAHKVLRNIPLEKTPRDLEFSYDGKIVLFTQAGSNAVEVLDALNDKIVAKIPTGASPHYVNIFKSAMMGMVVVQGPGEILLFDQATYKPGLQIKVGIQPHWMAVSSDGKTAFVTNEGSNDLSVIDINSGKVTNTIPVGNQPRKVVVQPVTPISSDANVSIIDFAFVPAMIRIYPGQGVVWNNNDGSSHAVAFKDGSKGSETIFPGKSYSRKFEKPGSYEYYCSIHNYMTGKVEVMRKGL